MWKVRESVFRRYCRGWWDLHPHAALVHGMDPFWAHAKELYGDLPADTVINVLACGFDGVSWGASARAAWADHVIHARVPQASTRTWRR